MQARTTSTRLPRKALLPVAGYPSAILAALRASNQKHHTILATSDDRTDDELAAEARRNGLIVFRGPLQDVLRRYALATAGLPDDAVVVRLTGDNVVPDGTFVNELVQAFTSSGAECMGMDSQLSGMPYGLGGEAFSVVALRKADSLAVAPFDREHVGPWMKRNCSAAVFGPARLTNEDFSHLRCTIDDEPDYQRILQLFEEISNPLEISWLDLTRKLASLPDQSANHMPSHNLPCNIQSKLTLGTAQLGTVYGWVNDAGKPSRAEAVAIIRKAVAAGVSPFDTARGYGQAEDIVGEALGGNANSRVRVITKLDLVGLDEAANETEVRRRVDESINSSSRALRIEKLDTLLLHRWSHHHMWRGVAWQRLLEHRDGGRIARLGASVYEPSEALDALGDSAIQHLQIPMNVLDWRWKAAGVDRALADRPDTVVHARSALLQGILAHPAERWPDIVGFDSAACADKLSMLAKRFHRTGIVDLCFAYVRSLSWVNSVVVGCETIVQLEQNLEMFTRPKLTDNECAELEGSLQRAPEALLNPAKWPARCERVAAYAS